MKIDLTLLKNVVHKSDGKIVAQCPACFAEGHDSKGEHLVMFSEGKFGCITHDGDKAHNRKILQLAGLETGGCGCRLTVTPLRIPDSGILLKIGRIGRAFVSPKMEGGQNEL